MLEQRFGTFAPSASPERARIRGAVMSLMVERGFEQTTVEMVAERAGVERTALEEDFTDLRDCCIRVYLANIDEFDRIVFGRVELADGWRDKLRASAYAAVRYIQRRPVEARFNLIAMLNVGETAQAFRDSYVERIVDLIDAGRAEQSDPDSVPRDIATGAFGSIYEFLVKQFHDGADISRLERHVPDLMYLAVCPYIGHDRARAELAIPPPPRGEYFE
jgi:AcrR family transcriptional regulator